MNMEDLFGSGNLMMVLILVAGLLIGGAAAYLGTNMDNVSSQQAGEKVVSTLERTGQQVELVRVEEQDGLYRVDVSDNNNQLQTYFVTKNGRMMTTALTDIEQVNNVIDAQEEFSQCLQDKNVVMYGNATQAPTVQQIQVLGGVQYVPTYKDVNSPDNLQEAADRGIQAVPAFYYNGSTLQGINNLQQIGQFTGCQFQVNQ